MPPRKAIWPRPSYALDRIVSLIFQVALTSNRDGLSRGLAAGIGLLAIIVAVAGAHGFTKMGTHKAAGITRSVER